MYSICCVGGTTFLIVFFRKLQGLTPYAAGPMGFVAMEWFVCGLRVWGEFVKLVAVGSKRNVATTIIISYQLL